MYYPDEDDFETSKRRCGECDDFIHMEDMIWDGDLGLYFCSESCQQTYIAEAKEDHRV